MKRISLYSLLIIGALFLNSCASVYLTSGKEAHEEMMYHDAINNLEKGLAKKSDADAYRKLADAYMQTGQYGAAMNTYDRLIESDGANGLDKVSYAKALMGGEQYTKASEVLADVSGEDSQYAVARNLLESCQNIEAMKRDSFLIEVKRMYIPGSPIAFGPIPYEDGIVYTAEVEGKRYKDPYTNQSFADLYFAKKEGETWSQPKKLAGVNGNYHDGVPTFSADGKTMIFTRSNYVGLRGLGENEMHINTSQLYQSTKNEDGSWTTPVLLNINDDKYMYAHPTLSADGNTLIFSSDKADTKGGMDLWKSTRSGSDWSTPVNLGNAVNTAGDEVFPTLVGNDSLYFSSDSHSTLGGLDILLSTKSIGGSWKEPEHLSYPINSAQDDFGLSMLDEENGYFSSNRSGDDQIYSLVHHNPIIIAIIELKDEDDLSPLVNSKVIIKNLTDGTEEILYTDEEGRVDYEMDTGKEYQIITDNQDYFTVTEDVSTIGLIEDTTFNKTFNMKKLVVVDPDEGDGIVVGGDGNYKIPNIHWDYNKWEVREDAQPYLDDLAKLLMDNENLIVQIESHADARGSHTYNDRLSKKRAKAVTDYLISKGVPKKMLQSKGYGKRKPINDCGMDCTEEQHQENRRTEFAVIGKK